jgi:hypothetical protein
VGIAFTRRRSLVQVQCRPPCNTLKASRLQHSPLAFFLMSICHKHTPNTIGAFMADGKVEKEAAGIGRRCWDGLPAAFGIP